MTPPPPDAEPGQPAGAGAADRPYQSLYRRYRPQRFDEVRGQEHVTRALRNAVRDGRIAHAYLFSGPRGTGKTSTARILAKALNCAAPVDGEPCGVCASCVSIVGGTSFDVHELDAASNNGVDAMRDLVARSALATPGRWKVYIVDEVHMLSTAASNALLKTLEEPPEHVVFVLATTDPQKVLPTIRSRTQHFEFHLLGEDVLEGLLADVAADAGLELPEGGLGVALRRGRGSARDALSVLDQVAASGAADDDTDVLAALAAGIAERDTAAVLGALDGALRSGRDPQQVAIALVERLRAGFLALVAPGSVPADAGASVAAEGRALGAARCVRSMELVGAAILTMRDAPEPRITFEVALVRCAHPEADETIESLLDRIATLERRLGALEAGGGVPSGTTPAPAPLPTTPAPTTGPPRPRADPAPPAAAPAPPAGPGDGLAPGAGGSRPVLGAYRRRGEAPVEPVTAARAGAGPNPAAPEGAPTPARGAVPAAGAAPDRDALVSAWGDHVLVGLRPKVRAYYQVGRFVGSDGADAVFGLPNAVHVAQAQSLASEVAAALSAHFGRPVGLRLVVDGEWKPEPLPEHDDPPAARARYGAAPAAGPPGDEARDDDAPAGAAQSSEPPTRPVTPPAESAPVAADDEHEEFEAPGELAPAPADAAVTLAEDRLLQAFPGAEEV